MKNQLTIFEGIELEILTKEDVNIDFNGEVLFNGKQTCKLLEYSNDRDAISTKVRGNQKIKIKNLDVVNHDFRKLNNAGETFLTENGVMRLIMASNMPKAEEFEDLVWEIVKEVQATGKYDSKEKLIMKIEDEKERELTLAVYKLEEVLKVDNNDMITMLNYKNKCQDLKLYKQEKQVAELTGKVEEVTKTLEDICIVGDRKSFTNQVNKLARQTGLQQSEIYNRVYKELENLYGINLHTRCENKKKKIQDKRLDEGKKPLSPTTLKSKCSSLNIADEENLWNELKESLLSVRKQLLNTVA